MAKKKDETLDRHKNWVNVCQMCVDEVSKVIENCDDFKQLPSVVMQLLTTMMPFEYNEEFNAFTALDRVEDKGFDFIRHGGQQYGKEVAHFIQSKEELVENAAHFLSYNLLDDGELSLIDGKVVYPDYETYPYWGNNITPTGLAAWILEQIGIKLPVLCVWATRDANVVIFESESFTEYMVKLEEYINEKGYDSTYARLDMFSETGKLSLAPIVKLK